VLSDVVFSTLKQSELVGLLQNRNAQEKAPILGPFSQKGPSSCGNIKRVPL